MLPSCLQAPGPSTSKVRLGCGRTVGQSDGTVGISTKVAAWNWFLHFHCFSSRPLVVNEHHHSLHLMAHDAIPPPYSITADDKRGLIVVIVAIVLAFVWVCSLIRIWLRYQARDWKNDDWLLAAATVSVHECAFSLSVLMLCNRSYTRLSQAFSFIS